MAIRVSTRAYSHGLKWVLSLESPDAGRRTGGLGSGKGIEYEGGSASPGSAKELIRAM